uniref:DDE Tnp4 domain-containing protein n=1 Tax=Lactuca sativa TaxID=4236 RepID=A0A9R1VJB3_LACSA|nr:hypothetical protein LSAT_V11C500262400 [Lactuca sativa]
MHYVVNAFDNFSTLKLILISYYHADGIYPTWVVFVNAYPHPSAQELARKDVERDFGVLKGHWDILKMHVRAITVNKTINIMYNCILLHNMILHFVNIQEIFLYQL